MSRRWRIGLAGGLILLVGSLLSPALAVPGSADRLGGADRFGTAVAVSGEMFAGGAVRAYVANAFGFPDALAAASGLPGPVLLTGVGALPGVTRAELVRLAPEEIFVVGGPAVVSDAVNTQLQSLVSSDLRGTDMISTTTDVASFNPFVPGADSLGVPFVADFIHVGVADLDPMTNQRVPDVVTQIPSFGNGGLVVAGSKLRVTYDILRDATWADGTPITGHDFQFTLDTILANTPTVDADGYDRVTSPTPGYKTFTYDLPVNDTAHEWLFGTIVPEHDVAGSDLLLDWNAGPWVSGGPFVVESFDEIDGMRLIPNEYYYRSDPATGRPLPLLAAIEVEFVLE